MVFGTVLIIAAHRLKKYKNPHNYKNVVPQVWTNRWVNLIAIDKTALVNITLTKEYYYIKH